MDTLTQSQLIKLIETSKPPCVSLYLSTMPAGSKRQQNRIRLKNLLVDAEKKLVQQGHRRPEAIKLLEPATALLDEINTAPDEGLGMAIIRTAANFACWKLPVAFRESVTVGPRCYIKPLVPLLISNSQYYLLAVCEKSVALYAGSPAGLDEVQLADLPRDMAHALNYDQPEGQYQVRSGQPSYRSKEGLVFHGQGEAEHAKDDLERYFRAIDLVVAPYLKQHGHDRPLLFCGVEYLYPIYRRANTYNHLHEQAIAGNPQLMPRAELIAHASQLLAPLWNRARQQDESRLQDALGSQRATGDLERILPACQDGAVEALFVAGDVDLFGRYDSQARTLELSTADGEGDELLDMAVRYALRNKARVYVVPADQLPAGLTAAALLRYSHT